MILAPFGLSRIVWRIWPLWGSILAICLIYMAVDSRLLYLTPVMPLVISLSAGGAVRVVGKLGPQSFGGKKQA